MTETCVKWGGFVASNDDPLITYYRCSCEQKQVLNEIIGKKIKKAYIESLKHFDDAPYLIIEMDDKTKYTVISDYGGYGGGKGEYPRFVTIHKGKKKMSEEGWD